MFRAMLNIGNHFRDVLTTSYGFIAFSFAFFWNFIHPEIYSFGIVGFMMLLDLFWGVIVALKQNKFVLTDSLLDTFRKGGIYASVLLPVFIIERSLHDDWMIGTRIACAIAAACEIWSVSALMLIIKPDMLFLRLFRLQLKGEMEKKIGQNLDGLLGDIEIDEYYKAVKRKRKTKKQTEENGN